MKRIAAVLLGVLLMLLASCAGGAKDSKNSGDTGGSAAAPPSEVTPEAMKTAASVPGETESDLAPPSETMAPELVVEMVNSVLK